MIIIIVLSVSIFNLYRITCMLVLQLSQTTMVCNFLKETLKKAPQESERKIAMPAFDFFSIRATSVYWQSLSIGLDVIKKSSSVFRHASHVLGLFMEGHVS